MVIWKLPNKYSHVRYRFWEFDCHVFVKTCRDHSLAQGSKHMFLSCLLIQQPIRGEHPQKLFEEWNILPTLLRQRLWFSFWKNNRSKNKTTRVVDYKMIPQLSWTTRCGDVSQPTISEPKASDFAQMAQVIGWLLQSVIDPSVLHARNEAGSIRYLLYVIVLSFSYPPPSFATIVEPKTRGWGEAGWDDFQTYLRPRLGPC